MHFNVCVIRSAESQSDSSWKELLLDCIRRIASSFLPKITKNPSKYTNDKSVLPLTKCLFYQSWNSKNKISYEHKNSDGKHICLKKENQPEPLKRAPHVRGDGIQRSYDVESNGDDNVLKNELHKLII